MVSSPNREISRPEEEKNMLQAPTKRRSNVVEEQFPNSTVDGGVTLAVDASTAVFYLQPLFRVPNIALSFLSPNPELNFRIV